jgi:hypothetical protein
MKKYVFSFHRLSIFQTYFYGKILLILLVSTLLFVRARRSNTLPSEPLKRLVALAAGFRHN